MYRLISPEEFTFCWICIRRVMTRELPLSLSVILSSLCETARSFIQLYEENEPRMQAIKNELVKIFNEFKKVQDETSRSAAKGKVAGGLGTGVGLFTTVFTGFSLYAEAGRTMKLAVGGLITGAAALLTISAIKTVIDANAKKSRNRREISKYMEQLDKECMMIVEPQKNVLEKT